MQVRSQTKSTLIYSLLLLIFAVITLPPAVSDERYRGSAPPIVPVCGPTSPGSQEIQKCDNLAWMKKRYHKYEGKNNRGLIFLQALDLFIKKSGRKNGNYSFDIAEIEAYFGESDYTKKGKQNEKNVTQYAYLFNNHAQKDWACIISSDGKKITSIVYTETTALIMLDWKLVE